MLIWVLFILTSCTEVDSLTKQEGVIRTDLRFTVNDSNITGSGVVKRQTSYNIKIELPSKTKYLFITTCHREPEIVENPPSPYTYKYTPVWDVEFSSSCLFTVTALTDRAKPHYGVIDFTADETATAKVYCNGITYMSTSGASLCEARAGLIQMLRFDNKTGVFHKDYCPAPTSDDGIYFKYKIAAGLCIYRFKSVDGKVHRHTTRGYTELPIYF